MGNINFTWWNLQNFFDTDDDPISKDFEYTSAKGWTQEVFEAKKTNLANALNAVHGGLHDIIAVAEIEKDDLLKELIEKMGNTNLKVISDPKTSDYRGIDVAVAFNSNKLSVLSKSSEIVHLRYRTRDIFTVKFKVNQTGEELVLIATHWPSRMKGQRRSEPLRIAVAEHIAYIVEDYVKVMPEEYEDLREQDNLTPITNKWDTKVMVVGDFNDEPCNRSVVDHLRASSEIDRVRGETNDIDKFKDETADYRSQDVFLYNAMWKFFHQENVGTYFMDQSRIDGKFANRYQILDQIVVSRGLLADSGLRLDPDTVEIFREKIVATSSGRPRPFDKKTKKGTSDHVPITAVLKY